MKFRHSAAAALCGCALLFSGTAGAFQQIVVEEKVEAKEVFEGLTVAFEAGNKYQNVTVTITGPRDYRATVFLKDGIPQVPLEKYGKVVDGNFNYQIFAGTFEQIEIINPPLNNGRGDIPGAKFKTVQLGGVFCVKDGKIVPVDDTQERGGVQGDAGGSEK